MGKNVIISTLPNISQNYLPKVNTSNIFANSLVYDDGSSVLINTTTASAFKLDVNGTARTGALTLTGALSGTSATFSGNMAIGGVSLASWYTGYSAMQIGASASIFGNKTTSDTNTTQIANNAYLNTAATAWVYINSDEATRYEQVNGEHKFYTAASGTAGNNITWTTPLSIASTGAATFSSSVTAGGNVDITGGNWLRFQGTNTIYSNAGVGFFIQQPDASTPTTFRNSVGGTQMTIATTGAATFSSSVTANGDITYYNASNLNAIITSGAANNGRMYIYSAGNADIGFQAGGISWFTNSLGIGTTDPSTWIDGSIGLSIYQSTTGRATLSLAGTNTSADEVLGRLLFTNTATTNTVKRLVMIDGVRGADANSGYLTFSTANSGNPAERMRITSGGYVSFNANTANTNPPYLQGISIGWNKSNGQGEGMINWSNAGGGTSPDLTFNYWNNTTLSERMRITSGGNVILSQGGTFYAYTSTGGSHGIRIQNTSNNTNATAIQFRGWNDSVTGSIDTYVNVTTYNTSSDYRLKEDLKSFNAIELISKLKMYDFKWKEVNWRMYGGLAHEIAEILPYSVTGIKDGDVMQGVDYSKLTPILVKAIQELKGENDTLKADIESLKALINK